MTIMLATDGESSEEAAVPFMVFEVEVCTTDDDATMGDVTVSSEPVTKLKPNFPGGVGDCSDDSSDVMPTSLYYTVQSDCFPDIPSISTSSSLDAVSQLDSTTEDSVSLIELWDGEYITTNSIPEISSLASASSSMDIGGTVCNLTSIAEETGSIIQGGGGDSIAIDSIPADISSITASSSINIDGTVRHLDSSTEQTVSLITENALTLDQALPDSSSTDPIVNIITADSDIIQTLTDSELTNSSVFALPITTPEVVHEIVISNPPSVTIPSVSRSHLVSLRNSNKTPTSFCSSTRADDGKDPLAQIVDSLADSIIDPELARAATDAVQTGSLTPLVKEELRSAIRYKRWVSGKEDIQMEPPKPCAPDQLDSDEELKAKIRRTRNKLAAQKCRTKRKDQMDKLENECQRLQNLNENVQEEIEMLENEKLKLQQLMLSHDLRARDCNVRLLSGATFSKDV